MNNTFASGSSPGSSFGDMFGEEFAGPVMGGEAFANRPGANPFEDPQPGWDRNEGPAADAVAVSIDGTGAKERSGQGEGVGADIECYEEETSWTKAEPTKKAQPREGEDGHTSERKRKRSRIRLEISKPIKLPTINEPTAKTFKRDLTGIGVRLLSIVMPCVFVADIMKTYDLFGPLLFFLVFSIFASIANGAESSAVFAICIGIYLGGSLLCGLNATCLGGNIRILQTACVLGYADVPIIAAQIVCAFVHVQWVQGVVIGVCTLWSMVVKTYFMISVVPLRRRPLVLYPMFLFDIGLASLVFYNSNGKLSPAVQP